jgi:high frequency lysogenization protein
MNHTDQDRAIAFAGIYQAAALVHQIATQGQSDTQALTSTLNSLFVTDPQTTAEVFGDVSGVRLGLQTLRNQMSSTEIVGQQKNMHITQYVIGMIALEAKLRQDTDMEATLFKKLSVPEAQCKHFGLLHENTLAGMALIFTETLSRLRPKILVKGAHGHLNQAINANRIRSCLLAGVRAARLWRQLGGSRWHLLFKRGRYTLAVDQLLEQIRTADQQQTLH